MPRYILLHNTASTNTYLSKMATILPSGTVIHTHNQSEGRGQRGNSWEAEPGKNITFSMLVKRPAVAVSHQFAISEAVAVGIVDVLNEYAKGFTIKWPNDIYHHNSKVCGILIEHSIMGSGINHSIIGVGLNINQTTFVSDAPNPISLAQITGKEFDLDDVLHKVCESIERRCAFDNYSEEDFANLHQEFLSMLYRNDGEFHSFAYPDGTLFGAKIVDVEPYGMIVLEKEDGTTERYAFKEISFII